MIWCRFADGGPGGTRARFGFIEEDQVTPVSGDPFGEFSADGPCRALSEVELLAPVVPGVFYACGLNYRAHIEHAAALGNPVAKLPERPEIGYRANNALTGHRAPIVIPADLDGPLEAEPEVVAVIGRPLRHAGRDEAAAAILGWTLGNDVSARTWQRGDRTFWRAKNTDTFKPMGPWIDTEADPMGATTTLTVNGAEVASFATGAMIFDALDFIVEMTRYLTLAPGDVIWMGADATAPIAVGDTVDITVSGLATLSNPVVAAALDPSTTTGGTMTARHPADVR